MQSKSDTPGEGLAYRPIEYDDWGVIRNKDGSMFASVRRPLSEDEAAEHRANKTDPFEDLARHLIASYAGSDTAGLPSDHAGLVANDRSSHRRVPDPVLLDVAQTWDTTMTAKDAEISRLQQELAEARAERDFEAQVAKMLLSWAADHGEEPDLLLSEWIHEKHLREAAEAREKQVLAALQEFRNLFSKGIDVRLDETIDRMDAALASKEGDK